MPGALPRSASRTRHDLCPGVFRPWAADDGALVRLRLVGGRVAASSLSALSEVAATFGDGDVHVTGRANLQLRALPAHGDDLAPEVVDAIEASGLLPSRTHELVRNIMVSPQSGLAGGRADLRPVASRLDELLCAKRELARLPGRFLFVLDDGRGDLVDRTLDVGLVALDTGTAQLRMGSNAWGPVVSLSEAPHALTGLAQAFLRVRGDGPDAPWHVDELPADPDGSPRDRRTGVSSPPLPYGAVPGGEHVVAPGGVLSGDLVARLVDQSRGGDVVVTPWRGVLVPRPGVAV
jgi:precorrin-3B synthase